MSSENIALLEMFEQMKDLEIKAEDLYSRALKLTLNKEILGYLKQLIKDESRHYKNVLEIIKILNA